MWTVNVFCKSESRTHPLQENESLNRRKKYLRAVKRTVQKYIMITINSSSSLYLKGISNRME